MTGSRQKIYALLSSNDPLPIDDMVERTGLDVLRGLVATLKQSLKFGTPLAESVRVIAAEMPRHLVIFDMPPLTSDDVLTFAPRVDGVLLVVAEGRTERSGLTKAREMLAEMNLIGVVLNCSSERDDRESYY